jgi:hypothetical protein
MNAYMNTRIYDSAEPGPPRGWLSCGIPLDDADQTTWTQIVTLIMQALDKHPSKIRESSEPVSFPQHWGALHEGDRYWVYRIFPAGKDRFGRAGRTLTSLFCGSSLDDFVWGTIEKVASQLESLATSPSHLEKVKRIIECSLQPGSLVDQVVATKGRSLEKLLTAELEAKLAGLKAGDHYSIAISEDAEVTERKLVNHLPKKVLVQPGLRQEPPKPVAHIPISLNNGPNQIMFRLITYLVCVALGFGIGFVFNDIKPDTGQTHEDRVKYRSDKEVIAGLLSAVEYLEEKANTNSDSSDKTKRSKGVSH